MDVHIKKILVTGVTHSRGKNKEFQVKTGNDVEQLEKLYKGIEDYELSICYEAGQNGYGLARELRKRGYNCVVIAPSKTPIRQGNRVKTDRRDSEHLAKMLRAEELSEVEIPSEEREAHRNLLRCRHKVAEQIGQIKNVILKFMTGLGHIYDGKSNFTIKHHEWIKKIKKELHVCNKITLENYVNQLVFLEEQKKELQKEIEKLSTEKQYANEMMIEGLKGLGVYSSMLLLTEIGSFSRFEKPKKLMSYIGLTPSEESSGDKCRRGGITKAGNTRCRKILIEASWNYILKPAMGKKLIASVAKLPSEISEVVLKAHKRLRAKYKKLQAKKKHPCKIATALARELVGFIWHIATMVESGAVSLQTG